MIKALILIVAERKNGTASHSRSAIRPAFSNGDTSAPLLKRNLAPAGERLYRAPGFPPPHPGNRPCHTAIWRVRLRQIAEGGGVAISMRLGCRNRNSFTHSVFFRGAEISSPFMSSKAAIKNRHLNFKGLSDIHK